MKGIALFQINKSYAHEHLYYTKQETKVGKVGDNQLWNIGRKANN